MKKLFLLFLITNMTAATLTGQVMMMFSSDPASGITSPLDIDSLFYWYAADVGVTTDNNKVTQWNDLSGNGHHVTQADTSKAPTLEATGGPNSRPTMTFDGTDDFMASAAHWWGSDDITVIAVYKVANATRDAAEILISRSNTTTDERQWQIVAGLGSPTFALRSDANGNGTVSHFVLASNGAKSTSYQIISSIYPGANDWQTLINGSSASLTYSRIGSIRGIFDNANNKLGIGANNIISTPTTFLQGSISEIIVFSRALTTAERSGLEQNYLCKKYGLACP